MQLRKNTQQNLHRFNKIITSTLLWINLSVINALLGFGNSAIAQIAPDNTLGVESSVVTPNIDIKGLASDRIDGGAIRGSGLFHSFQEFNVGAGRGAYFSNPAGIDNIFGRVTGNSASNIYGTLGVLGNANLFLLNPNGILFGPNASLDLGGSFVGSTANSLNFGGGKEFSATNPATPPLLSVSVPLGVQFNQPQPSPIVNSGNLAVSTGQNLTLLGGTVASTGNLSAPAGQIAVAAVPGGSVVNLNATGQLQNIDTSLPVGSGNSASLAQLLSSSNAQFHPGLTVNSNGQTELSGSGLSVGDGDVVAKNVTAQTATLTAHHNLTLVESLIGTNGDLNLLAGDTVRIRDSVANPFVAQAGGKLLVQGRQGVDIFALNHPSSGLVSGGDMILRSANTVGGDAHYWAGGNFRIEQMDGSLGGLFSPYDPIIRAAGDVSFDRYQGGSLHILAGGSVTINGTVEITGADANALPEETVTLSDGSPITIDGTQFPTLDIRAGVRADAIGIPEFTPVPFPGVGNTFPNLPNINPISPETREIGARISIGTIINRVRTTNSGQVFLTNQYESDNSLPGGLIEIRNPIVDPEARNLGSFSIRAYGNPVTIDARGDVRVAGIITGTGDGNGGNIKIISGGDIDTRNGNILSRSSGRAGDVTLQANGNINSGNIEASNTSSSGDANNFSTITLESLQGSVFLNQVQLEASNNGSDYAGIINIYAPQGNVEITGTGSRDPGQETILTNGYYGIINIQAGNDISIRDGFLTAQTLNNLPAPGQNIIPKAGEIEITSQNGNIRIFNSNVNSSTSARVQQDNRNIDINAGNINIHAINGLVSVGGISVLSTSTFGQGNAGNLIINSRDQVTFDNANAFTTVEETGIGRGGNISISIPNGSFFVTNGAQLQALTKGQGNAGNVTINARDISFDGESSSVFTKVQGNFQTQDGQQRRGGDITITTGSLDITNGAQLQADTEGAGNAGNIIINATDSVNISGTSPISGRSSALFTSTSPNSTGTGGNITVGDEVQPNLFRISDGAVLFASTSNNQKAGDIKINANRFEAINGGQLIARTTSRGAAGTITVNAGRRMTVSGRDANFAKRLSKFPRGVVANVISNNEVFSGLFVDSENTTARAGDIIVSSPIVFLDDHGRLIAESGASNGGNITLKNGTLLLLRRNSLISTTAGTARQPGNGGKILIDYPEGFVIAGFSRNNDIASDAFRDFGGRVKINALGTVNIEALSREDLKRRLPPNTPLQELDPQRLPTNDATAISRENPGGSGIVEINAPNVDPARGTIQLPEDLGDSSRLIAQSCPVGVQGSASRFVVTGRGGLPPNPGSPLSTDTFLGNAAASSPGNTTTSVSEPPREAQGVAIGPGGEILLTSRPSTLAPYTSWQKNTGCNEK
ncbi:two-partner secretion domain-containing protein [Anabaena sp. WFMT]|uniref:two-partner secretion domain-containing protein n=1 Tax=Anabaena sp. WFMT TaxID=3449730 RepID=UPI003F2391D7